MKPSIDNIGYAAVAISMLVLGIAAVAEHASLPISSGRVFELERVTIVASRDDARAVQLAAAEAEGPATRVAAR